MKHTDTARMATSTIAELSFSHQAHVSHGHVMTWRFEISSQSAPPAVRGCATAILASIPPGPPEFAGTAQRILRQSAGDTTRRAGVQPAGRLHPLSVRSAP